MQALEDMGEEELQVIINEQEKRRKYYSSEKGRAKLRQSVSLMVKRLTDSGYVCRGNTNTVVEEWTEGLTETVIEIGLDKVAGIFQDWLRNNADKYYTFPQVQTIVQECIDNTPRYRREWVQRLMIRNLQDQEERIRRDTEMSLARDIEVLKDLSKEDKIRYIRENYNRKKGRNGALALYLLNIKYGIVLEEGGVVVGN